MRRRRDSYGNGDGDDDEGEDDDRERRMQPATVSSEIEKLGIRCVRSPTTMKKRVRESEREFTLLDVKKGRSYIEHRADIKSERRKSKGPVPVHTALLTCR